MRVWRPLAEKGGHVAQAMLGVMYAKGEGVPQNYVLAHMWSNLAASKDNTEAAKHRGEGEAMPGSLARDGPLNVVRLYLTFPSILSSCREFAVSQR